eukprot:CAMPEP_0114609324 /NCGR_PEP_ID=MMETSP0168-20121206/3031_1 /TAXON_ID=95228 ORGANISM="Vannella sp., Strain DIVA3 517/6/12" /NCGR_SAMPLE_ID=MMETSP0168 /ASSEMBLY_ACC=CAM_ASM_000044 /LENGTH=517 /DNA_ID=CAMNT_0001820241 /DNA_START=77 /DNA_END=1627 /DNA_ORIENTATION=+
MSELQDLLDSIGSGNNDVESVSDRLDELAGGGGSSSASSSISGGSSAGGSGNGGTAAQAYRPAAAAPIMGSTQRGMGMANTALGVSVTAQRAAMLAQMQGMGGPSRQPVAMRMQHPAAQQQQQRALPAQQGNLSTASHQKALTLVKVVDAMKLRLGLDAKQIGLIVALQRQFLTREIDFQMYVTRLQHTIGRNTFLQVLKTFEGVRKKMATQEQQQQMMTGQPQQRPAVPLVAPRTTTVSSTSAPVYPSATSLPQTMLGKRSAPLSPRSGQAQPANRYSLAQPQQSITTRTAPSDPSARLPPTLQQQLVVNYEIMQKRVQELAAKQGLLVQDKSYLFLALAVQSRMKSTMEMLITYSKKRSDEFKDSLPIVETFEPKALLRAIAEKDQADQKRRDEEERLRLLSEAAAGDEGAKKEKLQKFLDAEESKRTNNAALQAAMGTANFKSKISRPRMRTGAAASVLPPSTLKLGSSASGLDLSSGRDRRITTRDMHAFLEHDIGLRTGNSSLPYIAFSGKG